jgi:predicted permease
LLGSATVTGNFFTVLGVVPQVGRPFLAEETWQTGAPVAIVSDRLWRERLGGREDIVGSSIELGGRAVQVVGVAPPDFTFPRDDVDVWRPLAWPKEQMGAAMYRRAHWLRVIARLRPGVSAEDAGVQLRNVANQLQVEHPQLNRAMGAGLTPLHEFLVGDTRLPLLVLLGAVSLLLLIACANVGNLLLVQAAGRERELSVRLALGAGRGRLVRQAFTESLVLSGIGGLAGLALGWWGIRILTALQPEGMLRVRELTIDWTVLGFILVITAVSAALFGIAPALWSGRRVPADALREGGRTGSQGRRMRRWGDTLVVGEVALALMLAVGAGLLVRSFWELRRVDPGFSPDRVLAVSVSLPGMRYDSLHKITAFQNALLARLGAHPELDGAALVGQLPLAGPSWSSDLIAAGRAPGDFRTEVLHREITPEYFRTLSVPVMRGRGFTDADGAGAPNVVVINDVLARAYFRDQDPIGQRVAFDRTPDSSSVWRTIVGVVGSEHQEGLATPARPEVLGPLAQDPRSTAWLVARRRCPDAAQCDPSALAPIIRRVVAEMDPLLALGTPRSLASVYADSLARQRFVMTLLLVFAGVGLLLAVVGVYGVLAHLARRRSREMGIRIALGARGSQVRWLVVRHGLRLTATGLAIGAIAALGFTRAMNGLLFRIAPSDPLTIVGVAALLALTSALASWLPAVTASRADPAVALRGE